jgi:23S rRNA (cytosine1962-C5)-methyltransferase
VLDAFCYQGATSVQAALGGAKRVVGLDDSESALAKAGENARANGVGDRCEFRRADSFKALKALRAEGARFDLVVLDPPPLAKSVHDLAAGETAFRRLAGQAIDLLSPGGVLVAASCSHHFSWRSLEEALGRACGESGRRFILSERISQPEDHPVRLGVPETEYLRTIVLTETVG